MLFVQLIIHDISVGLSLHCILIQCDIMETISHSHSIRLTCDVGSTLDIILLITLFIWCDCIKRIVIVP